MNFAMDFMYFVVPAVISPLAQACSNSETVPHITHVAHCDNDDELLPNHLLLHVEQYQKWANVGFVFSQFTFWDTGTSVLFVDVMCGALSVFV